MRIALVLAFVLALAAPAAAQTPTPTPTPTVAPTIVPTVAPTVTPTPEPTVQPGVTAGGLDLSGQTEAEALATVKTLRAKLVRSFELRHGDLKARLPVKQIKQHYDPALTARRAMRAAPDTEVKLAIDLIRTPIRKFVDKFASKVAVAPRDATIHITLTRIERNKAHPGKRLPVDMVNKTIDRAFLDPTQSRVLRPKLVRVKANIVSSELKKQYPSIITVDKSSFTLRLFKNLRLSKSYGVAVGQSAYPTPSGLFNIQSKQVNPTWTAPNSPWAGEAAGQSYDSSDPNNPLKARWMGVDGSVGIHGTAQDYSIGTAASHGCIRMHVSDVIDLYDRVSVGTPVLIQ